MARTARQQERFAALTAGERTDLHRRERAAIPAEVRRARKRAENASLKLEVLLGYGGRCSCCGNDYLPHLTLDHIDGGGGAERKHVDGRSTYRRLRALLRAGERDSSFQVLCWNCNIAKHHLGRCSCQDGSD